MRRFNKWLNFLSVHGIYLLAPKHVAIVTTQSCTCSFCPSMRTQYGQARASDKYAAFVGKGI